MSAHKTKVAFASTSTALTEARNAVKHFNLRCTDPDAKFLMASLLDAHLAGLNRLRIELLSSLPATAAEPIAKSTDR